MGYFYFVLYCYGAVNKCSETGSYSVTIGSTHVVKVNVNFCYLFQDVNDSRAETEIREQ